jgi:hypothetical protein
VTVILFVDTDLPKATAASNRKAAPERMSALLSGLGAYGDLVQVVVTSRWATGHSLAPLELAARAADPRPILGALWDDVPPLALTRYDHIIYWLTRRHVWRLPSWVAVQVSAEGWPGDHADKLVLADSGKPAEAAKVLRRKLEGYYWWDLWWGEGPAPDPAVLWRARALMVAWSVARSRWPVVLGRTAAEVEQRLDPLLTIHAGAQHRVRAGEWFPHWVHLPRAGLKMARPIELIETHGAQGISQILAHVWERAETSAARAR